MWDFRSSFQPSSLNSSPRTCIASSPGEDRNTQQWRGRLGEIKVSSWHTNLGDCNCHEIHCPCFSYLGGTDWWGNKKGLALLQILILPRALQNLWLDSVLVERGWDTSLCLISTQSLHPSANLPAVPAVAGKALKHSFVCISSHLFTFVYNVK